MKKLFLLAIVALSAMTMNAQINRNIFGVQLGSSMESAKKVLVNKGFEIHSGETELGYTLYFTSPIFSGIKWNYGMVVLNNGNVMGIMFIKDKFCMSGDHEYIDECNGIRDILKVKYKSYIKDPQDLGFDKNVFVCEDDSTRLVLTYKRENSQDELALIYLDMNAAAIRKSAIYDEL